MRSIITIIIVLLTVSLKAQHCVGFSAVMGVANQASNNYIENINNPLPVWTPEHPPKFLNPPVKEEPILGTLFALNYEYQPHKNYSFFSGITFSKSGFQINEAALLFRSQFLPSRGYVNPPNEPYLFVTYNFDYYQIGIHLGMNYFIPLKRMRFFIGAGTSFDFLTQVKKTTIRHERRTDVREENSFKSDYNTINASALLNFGAEWSLTNEFKLRILSSSQFTFTNFAAENATYTIHPYLSGIGISFLRQL